jgi:hypothetical protein
MTLRLPTLEAIEAAVWIELARAARDRSHGWRTPMLATVASDNDGVFGDARTVVLREVDEASRSLVFFTDSRSPKAAQIASHHRATLAMWSPPLNWQLRCRCLLSIENEGLAVSSRWQRLKLTPAAQDYLSPLAPGAELPEPHQPAPASMRECFAMVTAQVQSIDWLELHPEGHRRARFDAQGARWLQP